MDYETAKDIFNYDTETGILTWKAKPSPKVKLNSAVGCKNNRGYIVFQYQGKSYLAHRLIWLLTHKEWPKNHIDHINGVPDDNRLFNLREATRSENLQNKKAHSNTGVSGVSLGKNGRYYANLMIDGKRVLHITFKTFDEAVVAVTEAKQKYHTFHPKMVNR